jgi:hypothetical protein
MTFILELTCSILAMQGKILYLDLKGAFSLVAGQRSGVCTPDQDVSSPPFTRRCVLATAPTVLPGYLPLNSRVKGNARYGVICNSRKNNRFACIG